MRITPPHADINLYDEGFGGKDLLSRAKQSHYLSELVEKVEDPLVIALDGAWGSGKSFFLKCWVGAHSLENGGEARTIYFDAFEHDFLEDPLIALTGVLADRVKTKGKSNKALTAVKTAAAKLWRPAARIGLAAATGGLSETAGAAADGALAVANDELGKQVEDFWRKEDGKRAAISEFKEALKQLTKPDEDGNPTEKLVFVVDELDRCRPDFALNTLEVIKHFFFVPGVHFVLGVNFQELLSIVRVRYGNEVDAELYLQKFISVSIALPEDMDIQGPRKKNAEKYFEELSSQMGLNSKLVGDVLWWSKHFEKFHFKSIRQSQRILTEIALVPNTEDTLDRLYPGWRYTLAALILIKHTDAQLMRKVRSGSLSFKDIAAFLDLSDVNSASEHHLQVAHFIWASILSPNAVEKNDRWRGMWGGFGLDSPKEVLPNTLRDFLDAVKLTDDLS